MLVHLAAGFSGDLPQEAVAAPQLHLGGHRGKPSKHLPRRTRGGGCGSRRALCSLALSCQESAEQQWVASVSHGSLGEAGSMVQLQELVTNLCWNGMQNGGGFTARCLPKGEGWGGMQVSGVTALAALVLVCALQTQLQAQLRTCTGSDIEYVTLLRPWPRAPERGRHFPRQNEWSFLLIPSFSYPESSHVSLCKRQESSCYCLLLTMFWIY